MILWRDFKQGFTGDQGVGVDHKERGKDLRRGSDRPVIEQLGFLCAHHEERSYTVQEDTCSASRRSKLFNILMRKKNDLMAFSISRPGWGIDARIKLRDAVFDFCRQGRQPAAPFTTVSYIPFKVLAPVYPAKEVLMEGCVGFGLVERPKTNKRLSSLSS
ncbi:hypothetical protein RRG08_001247 [Elysia crispata]|uniref:Uncharacterized protein n=1 Tax=Elysia crispata TaxID=231223 RepID=A0AAE1EBW7_9GAST|nr:hypothetical protein RRG08_001247 [Elysia crispata]